ncbi:MAG: lysophospholipase [Solirubrobacterales bacterium]|nr:lysophospholipase [Solirubrobacterales bacterium]
MRAPTPEPPAAVGVHAGLAYTLWLPLGEPVGGVVTIHGASSCKENHHDFARACRQAGLAAVAFDQRGHGDSADPLDGRVVEDVLTIAELLPAGVPRAVRGSSMGGYVAIQAAGPLGAAAAVAICPAPGDLLAAGLRSGRFTFAADTPALAAFLEAHDLRDAVAALTAPLFLLHAEADEQVPVEVSRELAPLARAPGSRLIVTPGGHHRSIQHDPELLGFSVRFIEKACRATKGSPLTR